tara:strand:+ start:343 stop:801 length:459 start_codon:yes stop_codon:yes gene_type:complete
MKISKHISYREAVRSNTASRRGIDNIPSPVVLMKMENTADNLFEPLRDWVGGAIKVNSFYRCKALNTAIGGAKYSQHMKGEAIDIDDTFGYKTNAEMFNYIKDNLSFDQLIWEFGNSNNPAWLHVSYVSVEENRGKVTIAYNEGGKVIYRHI